MNYTWDDNKLALNLANHKVHFDMAGKFDWETAQTEPDQRKDYGEARYQAYGIIENRLYCLIFTPRGNDTRIISLRKANSRETKTYAANHQNPLRQNPHTADT